MSLQLPSRREFLLTCGGGFASLALTALLSEDGFFAKACAGEAGASSPAIDPLAPKAPHFAPKAKSVIFLFMYGGPSQVDLFDPKPALTKGNGKSIELEVRKGSKGRVTLLGSPFKFHKRGCAGIEISELYPHLGERVDDMTIVRSMWADSFAHGSAMIQMNTGSIFQGKPCLGSWTNYGLGTLNRDLPGFVVFLDPRGGPIGGAPNWSAGYMPATYQGTQFRTKGDPVSESVSARRGHSRGAALAARLARSAQRAAPRRAVHDPNSRRGSLGMSWLIGCRRPRLRRSIWRARATRPSGSMVSTRKRPPISAASA